MNISPVSFASAAPNTSFQEKISKPQTYTSDTSTAAAAGLNEDGKGKKSPLKKIVTTLIVAAAVVAGLALGAKKGVFNPVEGGNKTLETVKAGLKTAGDFIANKASSAKNFISSKFAKKNTTVTAGFPPSVDPSEIAGEFMA